MPTDSNKARELFLHVVGQLPASAWEPYLVEAVQGDAQLLQQVRHLLAVHQQAGSFLDQPAPGAELAAELLRTCAEVPPLPAAGTTIGPYSVREPIGEGGMGVVYIAEQMQPIRRKVALKLIKPGMDSQAVIARFEQERQALALMDHPNIAKVLDAGTMPGAGRPYFVMELVKGVPITQFCDEQQLATRQRLGLFLQVCQAVQHAHTKGIIHRDVKPSNVLVAVHDVTPVVKVIDFGVAKAIGQPLIDRTVYTAVAQLVGTPLYMSPEQAGASDLDIDTRSDIYSLGVLLYELLTGTTPFAEEMLRQAGYDEMRRIIREDEPPRPSTRLSTLAKDALSTVAQRRGVASRQLSHELQGELDWIVMKCLEKDRNRRYETASALGRDVERYLSDEPVEARPPTLGYRLSKAVKRHKAVVLAGGLLVLTLLGGVVGTSLGMVQAKEERDRTVEAEADTKAFADFLSKHILAATRPEGVQDGIGVNVTMAEALAKAEPELEIVFQGRPKAEALARHEIGVTWRNLGRYPAAVRHLERAVELRKEVLGPDHRDTLDSMNSLAVAYGRSGQWKPAEALHKHLCAMYEKKVGPDHPDTLLSMSNLAATYRDAGKFAQAIPLMEHVRARHLETLGPANIRTLITSTNLAIAYTDAGRLDEAIALHKQTLADKERYLGLTHPATLRSLGCLAGAYKKAGNTGQALTLAVKALAERKEKLGSGHHDTLLAMNNLAQVYQDLGQYSAALSLLEEVIRKDKAQGITHHLRITYRNNLAELYSKTGRPNRAVSLLDQTMTDAKDKLGADHPGTLTVMNNLALQYLNIGKVDKAIPLFEETTARRQATLGPEHPDTLRGIGNLAAAYQQAKMPDKARPLFEKVLASKQKRLQPDHPSTLITMNNLAYVYRQLGQLDKAAPLQRHALAKLEEKLGLDHPTTRMVLKNMTETYLAAKQPEEAMLLLRNLLARQKKRYGSDHPKLAIVQTSVGWDLLNRGLPAEAEPILRECLATREKVEPDSWRTFNARSLLGGALLAQKKFTEAEPLLRTGYEGMQQRAGQIPPQGKANLPEALERLIRFYETTGKKDEAARWRKQLKEHPPQSKG